MVLLKYMYKIRSIALKERRRYEDNHGDKIPVMQQCSTEQDSAVDSRRRLTNFKILVSKSV